MKIAFATIGDTRDIRRGSGTPYYLWQELLRQGHTVHLVGPLQVETPFLTRFFKSMSNHLSKRYLSYRDPFMGRTLGQAAGRILNGLDVDLVLTNDYCLAGYTPTEKPIVLYSDSFFPRKYEENVHPWFAGLSGVSIHLCQQTTARGLKRADACFFASQFVADEAKKYITSNKRSFSVIPYGANIQDPGPCPARTVDAIRRKGRMDLLFVGKDWERKGGNIAVEITRLLIQQGNRAHLHVVGVDLSACYPDAFVSFYGLLNKDDASDYVQLDKLFSTCDVLLVPSKAEGYGLVFVEAAAYGMPCLAYSTSGTTTSVGVYGGGILLDLSQDESDFVSKIEHWFSVPAEYEELSRTARRQYVEEKNWSVAVSHLIVQIQSLLGENDVQPI
jgi:glycosyltransferase involved in cell wall biosynthesis